MLRRIYGGAGLGGAILPPNDPRLMALTDHQIELEFQQFEDAGLFESKNKEAYRDDEFEEFEAELDAESEHTTSKPKTPVVVVRESKESNVVEIPEEDFDDIEWEVDEISDFED